MQHVRNTTWTTRAAIALALAVLVLISVGAGGLTAKDKLEPYICLLNAGQETGTPVPSTASGVGFLFFNKSTSELTFNISYENLVGGETAAHIHGPATPGVAAGIQVTLSTANPKNGCVGLTKDQAKMLKKGLLYVNVHTDSFLGGEIRGQILPVKGVSYKVL